MLSICGYIVNEKRLDLINKFLDEKNATRVDLNLLLQALTYLKELEL